MDARIHNECERQLLFALSSLSKYYKGIDIKVVAKKKGSLVDTIQIFGKAIEMGAMVADTIQQNPKITICVAAVAIVSFLYHRTQGKDEELKRYEKILNIAQNAEEAEALVRRDYVKAASAHYKSLTKETSVKKVEASVTDESTGERQQFAVDRKDFSKFILTDEKQTETYEVKGVTISVTGPNLSDSNRAWRGIYSGDEITFKISDEEFIKKVKNNEVKFGVNTYIKGTLSITETTDEEGKRKKEYEVTDVEEYNDDEKVVVHNKVLKRKGKYSMDDHRQLTLNF